MGVKICLFLLVCSLSFGYELDEKEKSAMNHIFGSSMTQVIVKDVVVASDIWDGAIADYTTTTGKIRVNAKKLVLFRENLIIVHEAIHWWQHKKLGIKDLVGANAGYSVSMDWTAKKLGIEAEAEVARQIALWFVKSQIPIVTQSFESMVIARDSMENRDKLWMYLERFMKMQRPTDWTSGIQ